MNYLAHIYLSGDDEQILLGNFMGDFVKGSQLHQFPESVQKGIKLHRIIDDFTDHHLKVKEDIKRIQPLMGRYAPIAIDIFYDHLLAKQWSEFSSKPLENFCTTTYQTIDANKNLLPDKCKHMFTYMKRDNWLYNYQYKEGIGRALMGLSRRTTFNSNLEHALPILIEQEHNISSNFNDFFTELIKEVKRF